MKTRPPTGAIRRVLAPLLVAGLAVQAGAVIASPPAQAQGWSTSVSVSPATPDTDTPAPAPVGHGGRGAFRDVVRTAWILDPARTELQTRRHSADARASAAGGWFAGGPVVSGSYMDDHFIGTNIGYTTYQGAVSVPLWLPGQGSATQHVAHEQASTLDEQLAVEHMALSIRVLDATAAVKIAADRVEAARALYADMQHLQGLITRAARVGEVANADMQQVRAATGNTQNALRLAQEEQANARATLESLCGNGVDAPDISFYDAPTLTLGRLSNTQDLIEQDPRVKAARGAVKVAEANLDLAKRSFMPNPEIGVDAIHEEQYQSPWDNRVGFHVSVPLPSDVRNVPIMTQARDQLGTATGQLEQARRMVRLELQRVRERVMAARSARATLADAATSLQRRADAEEKAWRVGEHALDVALRARQDAVRAQQAANVAQTEWHVAVLRLMIATGEDL
ncbi:TolC family protein [Acetobacter sp. TBRC 12305]|uniref:TolC family protein n=1 Tax=Acetobacter garciniae TaxID=2817435 RepID=A0A939HLQ5_9PROT|nr:TolC family protein [Acetobacter garciniae]MBO1326773.1 TolC family protein [Acetobacter garciniae]MBX0346525.1 TolC family protein [Acetobacter garciniae]